MAYVRNSGGAEVIYLDGVSAATGTRDGTLDNWATDHELCLANEVTGDRAWLGDLHLVAIYSQALTGAEVVQNYNAGTGHTLAAARGVPAPSLTPPPRSGEIEPRAASSSQVVTKYYHFGGSRVGMDQGGMLYYLVGDHLGTTTLVLDDDGAVHSQARHYPYGEERWAAGTIPTDYRFTGQRNEASLGLYHMGARFYDPYINRWLSPDSIVPVPGDPQALNRFSYVRNNPVRYKDPTGHYHRDVHYDLTYDLTYGIAKEIAMARGLCVDEADTVATQLAEGVASANQWADQEPFNISLIPGTNHWKSHKQAREDMEEAVRQASTLSFGYSLHAVQDYFAHFGQGSIALAGAQGRNRWMYLWSQDDRFSATGADLEELNPVPVELREFFAQDWGHGEKSFLLGIDPDAFDWNDSWDQVMVAETEYYLWEFLRYWFEWHYGRQPMESASDE